MKILNPDDQSHTLSVYPALYVAKVYFTILHELSGQSDTFTLDASTNGNYLELEAFTYTIKEGGSYELTIKDFDTEVVIYRGKAYGTSAADLQNYKLT